MAGEPNKKFCARRGHTLVFTVTEMRSFLGFHNQFFSFLNIGIILIFTGVKMGANPLPTPFSFKKETRPKKKIESMIYFAVSPS
jgi:hypothetical protein